MLRAILPALLLLLSGCQSAYYAAAEQVGYHKREILVDEIEDTRESQQEAQEQFASALEEMKTLVDFDGGDLEAMYDIVRDQYEDSLDAANEVSSQINAVDDVAEAMFDEWQGELEEYQSANLRRESQNQLRDTRRKYDTMIRAMRAAEDKMDPVLRRLKDNELYLKHNLNARAIGAVGNEFQDLEGEVERVIAEMNKAIAESDKFIATLQ